MPNLIQAAKDQVAALTAAACAATVEAGELPAAADVTGSIEIPRDAKTATTPPASPWPPPRP